MTTHIIKSIVITLFDNYVALARARLAYKEFYKMRFDMNVEFEPVENDSVIAYDMKKNFTIKHKD